MNRKILAAVLAGAVMLSFSCSKKTEKSGSGRFYRWY